MVTHPEDVVGMAGEMATLPVIFVRINEAVENPNSSFSEIAQIISGDSALSARLLKIVNSAFYGFSNKIETISHAITIIGTAQLRDLVLATAVIEKFQGLPSKNINMKSFWLHSISCVERKNRFLRLRSDSRQRTQSVKQCRRPTELSFRVTARQMSEMPTLPCRPDHDWRRPAS